MSLLTNGNFFFPGPTEVRSEVLQAMTLPMVPHRGAYFESIYARMQRALQRIPGTTRPVYVSSSSATGLMEAGIRCAPAGRHGAVCLVDSVTGIGGAELHFDELDYVLTGSQKALALPPGLSFAAAAPGFIEGAKLVGGRGLYFDLVEFDSSALKNQTPNTPSVTSVALPGGITSSAILKGVTSRGFTIGSGYGKNKETTVRIGHISDHTLEGLERCLLACDAAFDEVLA